MADYDKLHVRIEQLFEGANAPIPRPDPAGGDDMDETAEPWSADQEGTAIDSDEPARDPVPLPLPASPGELHGHGWEDYLDAINRGEHIGFRFDQGGVRPLKAYLPSVPGITVYRDDKKDTNILSLPLTTSQGSIGLLQFEKGDAAWSQQDIALVSSVIQRMAQHLENLRLLAQAEKYRQEAEDAARRMTKEGWQSYFGARQGDQLAYEYDRERVKPGMPFSPGTQDTLSFPIAARSAEIGQMTFEGITELDGRTTQLLSAILERLATHIDSLRLTEQTQKSALELQTVAEVSLASSTALDPKALLQQLVDLTKESFNLYHTHIYLLDSENQKLVLEAGASEIGRQMAAEGWMIFIDEESIVARCARTRTGFFVNDVQKQPDFLPNPLLPETASELAVPMIVGQRLLGVFDVQSKYRNAFTNEDMRTYATLAAQAAVAYQNAILFEEQMAAVERLRELDQLKTAFLANMSHELRTPLNSIIGFTQVIAEGLDGPPTEEMSNDLALIEKNGMHLLRLINEVLDMAKIEAGKMALVPADINLYELISDVLASSASLAREKNLSIKIEMDSQQKRYEMIGDNVRLRQVFLNLISNAIKFTNDGEINIRLLRRTGEIRVEVQDTGIGIPQNKLETVFEAFTQVDTSTTRKAGGTGLGLPISRRLVELHGGRLWAESSGIPGAGSTFVVELPPVMAVKSGE